MTKTPRSLFFRLLCAVLLFSAAAAQAAKVAVYHTSDVHGWYSARPALWDKENSTRTIGGFPALAALIEKEQLPYLLLDSGDMFQGTPEGILTKGMASVVLMNQLGYAAAVPGNHDYDYGEGPFKAMVSSAAFAMLGANVYYKDGGAPASYLKPYVILEKGGRRIAVLGLMNRYTTTLTFPLHVWHLEFRDEAAEAAKWLPELKRQGADAVIVIAHEGLSDELSLKRLDISTWTFTAAGGTLAVARAVPGIDLILGGHNHAAFLKGYHDPVSGSWLGESGYGLSYVTRAELNFDDKTGKLKGLKVENLPLWTDETGEDPRVFKTVAGFSADVDREMGQTVGEALGDLGFSPEGLDSAIGNWGCDVTRLIAGAELAFQNTKGIRYEIRKGAVRLRDLYQAVPFDNTVVTMRLTGAQIKRMLADNIYNGRSLMQVSGLEVEFKGSSGRPSEIRIYREGVEIKDDEEFSVATNSYLAGGGDGGAVFSEGRDIRDTMRGVRDILIDAFKAGPVTPPPAGRIKRLE
jgi:2',3'-cyclic-nucleotide 2'-phosphodiesterase/3'-nucleotidase